MLNQDDDRYPIGLNRNEHLLAPIVNAVWYLSGNMSTIETAANAYRHAEDISHIPER